MRYTVLAVMSLAVLCSGTVYGQEHEIRWSDIDCSTSKISVTDPSGLRCRATGEYSGVAEAISVSKGQSIFRRWASFGITNGIKRYYYVAQGVSVGAFIVADNTLAVSIKGLSPYAKEAHDFGEVTPLDGADYVRFSGQNNDNCIAIRKHGRVQNRGYQWMMSASECVPKAKTITDQQIADFISQATFSPN